MIRWAATSAGVGAVAIAVAVSAGGAAANTAIQPGSAALISQAGVSDSVIATSIHDAKHAVVTSVPALASVHARVSISGLNGTPTGTILVRVYSEGACQGGWQLGFSETLSNGVADVATDVFTRKTAGARSVKVLYYGNATYAVTEGACETVNFTKLYAGMNFDAHDAGHNRVTSVPFTETVHAAAKMFGQSDIVPTGYVLVRGWSNATCDGTGYDYTTRTLDADGLADPVLPLTITAPGPRSYKAHYSGDGLYQARWSPCIKVDGTKLTPQLTTTLHDANHDPAPAQAKIGQQIHPRIHVSGSGPAPTGNVQILLFNDATCSADIGDVHDSLANATADNPYFAAMLKSTPGVFSWRVEYDGDANYAVAKGPCLTQRWYATPDVLLTVHDGAHVTVPAVQAGTKVHMHMYVGGDYAAPTGDVAFRVADNRYCTNGTSIGTGTLSNGVVDDTSIDYTPKSAGTVWFQATYKGDDSYTKRTTACTALDVTAPPVQSTPGPSSNPTPKPTVKPSVAPSVAPSAAPAETNAASATDAPDASAAASDAPAATDGTAGDPTAGPTEAAVGAQPSVPPATEAAPGAGGTTTPASGATSGGLPIFPIVLLLGVIVLVAGFWFAGASRRRRAGATS